MLGWLCKRKDKPVRLTEFDHIMAFAQALARNNPVALIDLVRFLLRPLQSELLLTAIQNELHGARHEIEDYKFFMPCGPSNLQMSFNYPQLEGENYLVKLNRDPVLPCPWHRDRYIGTLANIGHEKKCGDWKEDKLNHKVTVWLPWGIAFVDGGNHSIAAGIVGGEGELKPYQVFDMSGILNLVQCDGKYYRSLQDGQILDSVDDLKIAVDFHLELTPSFHPNLTPPKAV